MSTPHTPGQWNATEPTNYFGDDNLFYEIRGHVDGYGDDDTIALVDATPLNEDWRWNNALLIAAAPDMKAALEGLQKAIRDARLLDVKKHWDLCTADAVACTALHKARGGAATS